MEEPQTGQHFSAFIQNLKEKKKTFIFSRSVCLLIKAGAGMDQMAKDTSEKLDI